MFGQIYFKAETDLFEESVASSVTTVAPANTIVVDPGAGILKTVGAVNNNIIHECVYLVKHRTPKVYETLGNTCVSMELNFRKERK